MKEMAGTGWSQDEASQSQQQLMSSGEPSNKAVVEKVRETMPSGSRTMAKVEKSASFQAKPSAEHNQEAKEIEGIEIEMRVTQVNQQQQQPLQNNEAILKDKSPVHLSGQLYGGTFSNQNRTKYWIDKNSNNCFMVYPRDIFIVFGPDSQYWRWTSLEETSNVFIDAAELLNVCWLQVDGKTDSTKLSPGTLYEVVFIVKMKTSARGWSSRFPVNVKLTLPDGNKQERKADLNKIPREEWIEIPVGDFRASTGFLGNIEFSLHESKSGAWKSGLLIKGVAVRPKN